MNRQGLSRDTASTILSRICRTCRTLPPKKIFYRKNLMRIAIHQTVKNRLRQIFHPSKDPDRVL